MQPAKQRDHGGNSRKFESIAEDRWQGASSPGQPGLGRCGLHHIHDSQDEEARLMRSLARHNHSSQDN